MAKKQGKKSSKKTTKTGGRSKTSGNGRSGAPNTDGKHLVIVESPTKARTINRYLGPEYVVMASVGHVRDLPSKAPKGEKQEVPGVDLKRSFEPEYEVLPDKKKTVTELRKAAKNAEDVWFATDLDREGEAIAWHLAEALDISVDQAKRVVFNAITKSEIERAFSEPRPIDHAKVNAQQARRILDRIVGYQVSPLLWKKVASGLSAGRVQSVAVRLVVEREREIEAFVPDEYWRLTGYFALDRDRAAELAPKWAAFLEQRDAKDNPPTVREQNAFLSEAGMVRAELVELEGEKFEPTVKADDVIGQLKELTPEAIKQRLDKAGEAFADPEAHDLTPHVRAAAETCGLREIETGLEEQSDARGPARWRRTMRGEANLSEPTYRVASVETKRTRSNPYAPFITSTMQQAASNRLGFPLQRTMRVAQQLYEGVELGGARGMTGLITYMRTDSTHVAGGALEMARSHIAGEYGDKYLPAKPNFYSSSNKDAQEAHEAIRPTDVSITPASIKGKLSEEQFKLYDLIWKRFVGSQMTPAEWDATTALIEATGGSLKSSAVFKASGRTLVFDGFYKVMGVPQGDEAILPALEEGQGVAPVQLDPRQHFTSPPPRYNEASLQKKLESEGIGRPSTYAAIIQTIQDREYVVPVQPGDRKLMATDLGKVVTDMLVEAFPQVMDVAYTREMESELDEIEEEKHDWRKMLETFYGPFKQSLDQAHEHLQHAKAASEPAPYTCPKCGAATEYRFGRNGRFLSCTRFNAPPVEVELEGREGKFLLYKAKGKARPRTFDADGEKVGWTQLTAADKKRLQQVSDEIPTCDYAAPVDREGKPVEPEATDIACPECGGMMTKRRGRFGPFLGCENYPDCTGIVKLDPKKGTVVLPKQPPLLTDVLCPKCESPLNLRDSKRGLWLSCSKFPKCRGRVGWSTLDEAKQGELEKQWAEHAKQNPTPVVKTVEGKVVEEGYVPKLSEGGPGSDDEAEAAA